MNGQAVVDVIKSCAPTVGDPWNLSTVSLDAVLVAMKIAEQGSELEVSSTCPSCNEITGYDINLADSLRQISGRCYTEEELTIGELTFKFKPLKYRHSVEASQKNFEMNARLLQINNIEDHDEKKAKLQEEVTQFTKVTLEYTAKSIASINMGGDVEVTEEAYITEFLANIDKHTSEQIRDFTVNLRNNSKFKPLNIKCPHCEHEYKQTYQLDFSDFFG
jgi:hypothetical protein